MFALFHLIFQIIKISIQATFYGLVTYNLIDGLSKIIKKERLRKWMRKNYQFWKLTGIIYFIGLLLYSFSYWGNHGLSDNYRIPVGYGQAVMNADGIWTFFYPKLKKELGERYINEFSIKDDKLCAVYDKTKYLVFDFKTSQLTEFKRKQEYEQYAAKNDLPMTMEFKDFTSHYNGYWSGWRFLLLP